MARTPRPDGMLPAPRLRVVPHDVAPWRADPDLQAHGPARELMLLGDAEQPATPGLEERLLTAFRDLLAEDGRREGGQDTLVISPLLCLDDAVAASKAMTALSEIFSALDGAIAGLTSGGLGDTHLPLSRFAVIPWVWLEGNHLASLETLFSETKRGGTARPIIHSPMTAGNAPRPWAAHGPTRLLADLLLLLSLSADPAELLHLFPRTAGQKGRFYHLFTSLFEFPLDQLVRHGVLRRLVGGGATNQTGVVPSPDDLMQLEAQILTASEDAAHAKQTRARLETRQDDLRELAGSQDAIPAENLAWSSEMSNAERHTRHDLNHSSWQRRAPILFDDYAAHMAEQGPLVVKEGVRKALESVADKLGDVTRQTEEAVHGALKSAEGLNDATGQGLAAGLAVLDGVAGTLQKLSDEARTPTGESPEAVIAGTAARKAEWSERESSPVRGDGGKRGLVERSHRLPSRLANALQALSAAGTTFFAAWLLVLALFGLAPAGNWRALVGSLLIAGGSALFIAIFAERKTKRYIEEEWPQEFWDQAEADAKADKDQLVKALEPRVKAVKVNAMAGLRRAILASRGRVLAEVSGFRSLIDDELLDLDRSERLRRSRGTASIERKAGRFRVTPEEVPTPDITAARFHQRFLGLIEQVVTLAQPPDALSLTSHDAVVVETVSAAIRAADSTVESLRDDAQGTLKEAIEHGWSPDQLPAYAPTERSPERLTAVVLHGARITERELAVQATSGADKALKAVNADLRQPDARSAASAACPPECSLAAVVQPLRWELATPRSPGGSP